MAAVVTSTDSPEAVKAAFAGKGTVTVNDDAGNDVTPKDAPVDAKVEGNKDSAAGSDNKEPENSSDSATEGNDKAPPKQDEPSKADKRIDKLTKQVADLTAQLKAATTKEPATQQTQQDNAPKEDAEPAPEDFDTQADYLKALSKWATKQARKEEKAEAAKNAEKDERQKIVDSWHEQQKAARAKYKDYDEVMSDDIVIGPAAGEELIQLPDGAEIGYYIGKHPEEAEALAKLTKKRDVAIALGVLREKVRQSQNQTASVTGKEKPKPITPVTGQSTGNVEKARGEMSYKEYKAKRNAELAARRKQA